MVYILLAPGFEEAEALVPADLLRRAGIEVALVALEGDCVSGGHQIVVQADLPIAQVNLSRMEMLVLPGGGKGVDNLSKAPAVAALVQQAVQRDVWLAAICAAPTLLGQLGLLQGKQAVCYPGLEGKLTGAEVKAGCQVVQDGKLITAQAAGAAYAFGLKLISVLAGEAKAREVQNAIYYT